MSVVIRAGNMPPQLHNMKNQIVVTKHAKQRWEERLPLEERKGTKIKDVAFKARYQGVNLNCFNENEVETKQLYNYLNNNFKFKYASNVLRYYEGYVFVFAGHKGRTLLTIIKVDNSLLTKKPKTQEKLSV